MNAAISHGEVGAPWSAIPHANVIEIVAESCAEDPERPVIITEDGLVITRREFRNRCEQYAGFLRDRVQPGDRVVVMLENRIEFMFALFGVIANRATMVSIAPTAQLADAGHILRDSEPVLAFAGQTQKAILDQLSGECPSLREILVSEGAEPGGFSRFGENSEPFDLDEAACEREDVVAVYYTSGATGPPKGCMLDHGWWLRVLDVDQRMFKRSWQDRQLCCLPFYYADPAIQLLTSLSTRGTMIAMRRFSVSRFWDVVRRYDATEVLSIASIPALLLKGEPHASDKDHRIRLAVHVGVPKHLHRQLVDRFGFHWLDNYGSTEGGMMARVPLALAEDLVGSGSIGVETPETEIRIVDDMGSDVAEGVQGEALIRGPDLFRGYLNQPEVTEDVLLGGWYHTGDLIRRDERGLLYFVGRKKDMIRRSGESISASEVESVIRSHPKVLEVAVIPVADELWGEEVKAFIVLIEGESSETLRPEEIVSFCSEQLAPHKVPRYIEYRQQPFERTPSMRVQKRELRERDDQTSGVWDREAMG